MLQVIVITIYEYIFFLFKDKFSLPYLLKYSCTLLPNISSNKLHLCIYLPSNVKVSLD